MEKGASTTQMGVLSLLRIAIGWHFLSEGLGKLLNGGWTARDYLATADGPLAGAFRWMADTPAVLSAVDALNVWGFEDANIAVETLAQTQQRPRSWSV